MVEGILGKSIDEQDIKLYDKKIRK